MEHWPTTISTPRLLLRPVELSDMPAITRLRTDPEVRRFLGGPVAEEKTLDYQRNCGSHPYVFGVTTRKDAAVIGSVSVDPRSRFGDRREVSYSFLPENWGRGYAREAVAAVVAWALEKIPSDSPSIIAVTQEANVRSRRLLEAIGMRLIDSFVEWDAPQVMYSVDAQAVRRPVNHRSYG